GLVEGGLGREDRGAAVDRSRGDRLGVLQRVAHDGGDCGGGGHGWVTSPGWDQYWWCVNGGLSAVRTAGGVDSVLPIGFRDAAGITERSGRVVCGSRV